MNLNRQHKEILEALELAGEAGINSFVYRTSWIQLPVRIKELKAKGYDITTKTNKDRSVNYILRNTARQGSEAKFCAPEPSVGHFCFSGDSGAFVNYPTEACQVCNPQPKQEVLFNG